MAGFSNAGGLASLNKQALDGLMNGILSNLDGAMSQVQQLQAFFAAHPDTDFTAANTNAGPTGYTAADVTNFKSAFARLDALRQIYQGVTAQGATPEDFRTFPRSISTLVH